MIRPNFHGGPLVAHCDACPASLETRVKVFGAALAIIGLEGWKAVHCGAGHGWCHFCPTCTDEKAWEDPANRLVAPGSARP